MPEHHDVLVVGGGTAGCVLAARLSEEPGRKVCLVEAGRDYGAFADGRWPEDMLDARALPMSHLWETEPEDRSAARARIIGGCSAHNACLVVWGSRADYDEWGDGWTFSELEPFLRRAEADDRHPRGPPRRPLAVPSRAARGRPARRPAPARRRQRPRRHRRHRSGRVNARAAVRWNTAFAYLDDARGPSEPHDRRRDTGRPRRRSTAGVRRVSRPTAGASRRTRDRRGRRVRLARRAAAQRDRADTRSSCGSGSMSSTTFRSDAA